MLVRDIIKRALRMLGVVGSGREPKTGQATDALDLFQAMILALPEMQLASGWIDQDITSDVTAEENDRLRVNSTDPVTITLPVSTTSRERVVECCGNITIGHVCTTERAPRDGARVWIADVYGSIEPRMYIYRADSAQWVLATALTLDSESPLGSQMDAFLPAMLALWLSPEYGIEPPPVVVAQATQGSANLSTRYRRRNVVVGAGVPRLTGSGDRSGIGTRNPDL